VSRWSTLRLNDLDTCPSPVTPSAPMRRDTRATSVSHYSCAQPSHHPGARPAGGTGCWSQTPSDGSAAGAGVLVADTGGVLVPCRFVKRPPSAEAGFTGLAAGDPVEGGQVPQPDGIVRVTGG
jgi:hypothetical protein